ncbi:putative RNA helicase-related protein required for pre-mRNA splicing, related [Monocercomonoides exilis]|uniref:putative RNA helicase-related protein required for pre-mRNA splicing, related n=1 Tax=Monocercomonoides exilis TaxID=2049356 RepID=UPI00355A77AF|nr:putative RNA helicase-related protein required for pre-mRNA splicing, related [Monocercomonoides exilis]|eukprot:MONOS_552.1-p1 / transcript=MONOS_552.1 / gene=MONOS_552 / organism=Monocercomonoides_exilis_PA203 / gene_product=RNA helicase-related protein required for pre-mRNA splicing, related / transcript_product=RNA helicase-related protein required for pre-mRNA splicing, related / location=Mono_scaffold00009:9449-17036(-) / protein_length=2474 / sequence_SO=supercontig / SO=protein_coding / is_pseudo=false
MADFIARETNVYVANVVLSQDRKARISEPSGEAERLEINKLHPMGDLVKREKPKKSQRPKKKAEQIDVAQGMEVTIAMEDSDDEEEEKDIAYDIPQETRNEDEMSSEEEGQQDERDISHDEEDDFEDITTIKKPKIRHFDESEQIEFLRQLDVYTIQGRIRKWVNDADISLRQANEVVDLINPQTDEETRIRGLNRILQDRDDELKTALSENGEWIWENIQLQKATSDEEKEKIKRRMQASTVGQSILDAVEGTSTVLGDMTIAGRATKLANQEIQKMRLEASLMAVRKAHDERSREGKMDAEANGEARKAPKPADASKSRQLLDLDSLSFANGSHQLSAKRFVLPPGSQEERHKQYDEITIPAPKLHPPPLRSRPINTLPRWAQPAFAGFEALNTIQSVVYQSAFVGGGNILVCAPTGAGKTNIAMLCFLHEMGLHLDEDASSDEAETGEEKENEIEREKRESVYVGDGEREIRDNSSNPSSSSGNTSSNSASASASSSSVPSKPAIPLRLHEFKMVYIAPMKSLVQEMTRTFSARLSPYGMTVRELSGDSQLTRQQLAETNVIVTTPEKWDIVTRKAGDRAVSQKVRLVIIDEIHLLHDTRGPVLESIIARITRSTDATGERVRIVGLSATLPNYEDIGELLRVRDDGSIEDIATKLKKMELNAASRKKSKKQLQSRKMDVEDKKSASSKNGDDSEDNSDSDSDSDSDDSADNESNEIYPGLFHFPNDFRPVPLRQTYIGVKETKGKAKEQLMNSLVYEKILQLIGSRENIQPLIVFVHSRKETAETAKYIRDRAFEDGILHGLTSDDSKPILTAEAENVLDMSLKSTLPDGIGIHHAGLALQDRRLVEDLFDGRHISVLVSTATLAWGVNLPAHTVIIKGTQVYSPEKSAWVEVSPMDIMQMLGRAGRPQHDASGEGVVITSRTELQYYLYVMNEQLPIESQLITRLADHINAEVVLGNIVSLSDAVEFLKYSYLYIRMRKNPALYQIDTNEEEDEDEEEEEESDEDEDSGNKVKKEKDPVLRRLYDLAYTALVVLSRGELVEFHRQTGKVQPRERGRISSQYYILPESMAVYKEHLRPTLDTAGLMRVFALSSEFRYMAVRKEEKEAVAAFLQRVPVPVMEDPGDSLAKIIVLLQSHIARLPLAGSPLLADTVYITQSASRIMRALFELTLLEGWAQLALNTLNLAKSVQRRMWTTECPLRQFPAIPNKAILILERSNTPFEQIAQLSEEQLRSLLGGSFTGDAGRGSGNIVRKTCQAIKKVPRVTCSLRVLPWTRSVLRMELAVLADFAWDEEVHGRSELFWLFIEDGDGERILHKECFSLTSLNTEEEREMTIYVNVLDPLPPQYFLRIMSDRWICPDCVIPIPFRNLILPPLCPPLRSLDDTRTMPINTALRNPLYQNLFSGMLDHFWDKEYRVQKTKELAKETSNKYDDSNGRMDIEDESGHSSAAAQHATTVVPPSVRFGGEWGWGLSANEMGCCSSSFKAFNALQRQVFASVYHEDSNILIAAPPGSGKTVCAELSMLRALRLTGVFESRSQPSAATVPISRIVYVAASQERCVTRYDRWRSLFGVGVGCKVSLLTGDSTSDNALVRSSHIIVSTAENWDAVARRWKKIKTTPVVCLLIIDGLQYLNTVPAGPFIESVVVRARMNAALNPDSIIKTRIVALSVPLMDSVSMADWLGVTSQNTYCFRTDARDIDIKMHYAAFDSYDPSERQLSMSRPSYTILRTFASSSPAMLFVPGTPQARLAAVDVLNFASADGIPFGFIGSSHSSDILRRMMNYVGLHTSDIKDENESDIGKDGNSNKMIPDDDDSASASSSSQKFGKGKESGSVKAPVLTRLLHRLLESPDYYRILLCSPSLADRELASHIITSPDAAATTGTFPVFLRALAGAGVALLYDGQPPAVQQTLRFLYRAGFLRLLILPHSHAGLLGAERAKLVVVAGATVFDTHARRQVDLPPTDLYQILGRAGRYGCDDRADVCVLLQMSKREVYRRFVNDPLPIESQLPMQLEDILNTQIAASSIVDVGGAVNYLTWTYLYRRLTQNPILYGIAGSTNDHISDYLSELVETRIESLAKSKCIDLDSDDLSVSPLNLGVVASYYNISCGTMTLFSSLTQHARIHVLLTAVSSAQEFDSVVVRHGEPTFLSRLAAHVDMATRSTHFDDSHVKVAILMQSHFSRLSLPDAMLCDLREILPVGLKLTHATVDVLASSGWLRPCLKAMELSQMIVQGLREDEPHLLLQLPHLTVAHCEALKAKGKVVDWDGFAEMDDDLREECLSGLSQAQIGDIAKLTNHYNALDVEFALRDAATAMKKRKRKSSNEEDNEADEDNGEIKTFQPESIISLLVNVIRDEDDEEEEEEGIDEANASKTRQRPAVAIDTRVHAPRFPKAKEELWWLVVGEKKEGILCTIKSSMLNKSRNEIELQFAAPKTPGMHTYTLYLMCDSYKGWDRECDLVFNVAETESKMDEE